MKIVFMGTSDFGAVSLNRLYKEGYDITGVFTQSDKPRNRGMKISYSPVKEAALAFNTPVFQPESINTKEARALLINLDLHLLVVVAYGKILSEFYINYPPMGAINIHSSLLPKYRGAAPVHWAIINGETGTGVTSQYIAKKLDAGDIILSKETDISVNETTGELTKRLSYLGADVLCDTIDLISSGLVHRIPQDETLATYAPLITKDMLFIDWSDTAVNIKNKVRGLSPKPAAMTTYEDQIIKVFRVELGLISKPLNFKPGEIITKGNSGIEIACIDGSVIITELQVAGKKRMETADFLRGRKV